MIPLEHEPIEAWEWTAPDPINGFKNVYQAQFRANSLIAYIVNGVYSSAFARFDQKDTLAARREIERFGVVKIAARHERRRAR